MAEYREIQGAAVQSLASSTGTIEGQIWYDNVNGAFKLQSFSSGAWSSGGALPAPIGANSGSGSTLAGFSMGGGTGPPASYVSATNTYDGTSWTGAPAMVFSSAYAGACGTIPTTLYVGGDGNAPGASNTYNGTSWTSITAIGFDGYQIKAAGDSANAFAAQGYYSSSGRTWNGSSWTTNPAAPSHNYNTSAVGTYNDASFLGGITVSSPAPSNLHQNWNGSSWTTNTVVPVSGGTGGQSSNNAPTSNFWLQASPTVTVTWDGSSWTTVGSLSTPRANGGSGGSSSAEGFIAGGPTVGSTTTEEFTIGTVTQTITTT